jgi:hypothetical protein
MSGGDLERQIKNVRRDIETLNESLALDRNRDDPSWPTKEEVRATIDHATWCLQELEKLKRELEDLEARLEK